MNLHATEIGVVAGAFLLFSFLPGVLGWVEARRRRRAAIAASPVTPPEVEVVVTESGLAETTTVSIDAPTAPEPSSDLVGEAVAPVAIEPAAGEAAPVADEGAHGFRLDDLRHARILETPPREVLDDPAGQQQWESGLRLAETHAAAIGGAPLSASFEPQARCFAGMRDRGEVKELRFFLFADLWPTAIDQAVGEAAFEIGAGGVGRAYVVRRV